MIFFVYEKQKDTNNNTKIIVEGKLHKEKKFGPVVLLVVIIDISYKRYRDTVLEFGWFFLFVLRAIYTH